MYQQLLFAALVSGSLYALIALGLNLVYGSLRLLNVAHGDLVMIGAYVSFWSFTLAGISPVMSIVSAAVLCGALGYLVYAGILRRMLSSPALAKRLEANSLIIFYGLSVILQNATALAFTSTSRGYQYLDTVYSFAGIAATGNKLVLLGVAATITFGALAFLRLHIAGWSLLAVIERKDAASVVGVDVDRVQMSAICAGFAIAGVAGVLVGMTEQVTPYMGFPFTIAAFVVIILGGLGNIFAGIVAGFVLGFVETFGVALTSATYRSILIYGLFVGALLLRPQGLFGKAVQAR